MKEVSIMKFFRSIHRYFRDAGKSIIRNFSLSLASISCITITLIVVAISLVLSYNVEKMTNHVSSNISIVVFLDKEVTDLEIRQVKENIERLDNIASVTFKSKKEYAVETKELDPRFALIVDSWEEENIPLLDSYEVKVDDIEKIGDTAGAIKKFDHVFSVNFGEEYIESVITIFGVIEKVCIGGVIALILVTAFLIANTIKLAIFSRKEEIEIMRLVGASNMAIRIPFIIEGSFIGMLGSIIPIALMCYGYNTLYTYLGGQLFSSSLGRLVEPYPFLLYGSLVLLQIGLVVGMFGSYRAVRKYLKI
jgi:cell division transport system permease protein